jgi:hypothetical protein
MISSRNRAQVYSAENIGARPELTVEQSFPITDVCLSADGHFIGLLTESNNVIVWDTNANTELNSWQYGRKISNIQFSKRGDELLIGIEATFRKYRVGGEIHVRRVHDHTARANEVTARVTVVGRFCELVSCRHQTLHYLSTSSTSTPHRSSSFKIFIETEGRFCPRLVKFAAHDTRIVACSFNYFDDNMEHGWPLYKYEESINVWDANNGQLLIKYPLSGFREAMTFAVNPIYENIVAWPRDKDTIELLDIEEGAVVGALGRNSPARADFALSLSFSADGTKLAAGFYYAVGIWDVVTRQLIHIFMIRGKFVSQLEFNHDASSICCSIQSQHVLRILNATNGETIVDFPSSSSGHYSQNSMILL